jgi:hypothetical protein
MIVDHIGTNMIWLKRVNAKSITTQEDICSLCEIRKKTCKTIKYTLIGPASNYSIYAICHGLSIFLRRNYESKTYKYIPFSIRR